MVVIRTIHLVISSIHKHHFTTDTWSLSPATLDHAIHDRTCSTATNPMINSGVRPFITIERFSKA
eukprot:3202105-Amphidinium_carterae.2